MEFKEFEPQFKSAKTQFKLRAGLNLETFDTTESTIFKLRLIFKPPIKFFKFKWFIYLSQLRPIRI